MANGDRFNNGDLFFYRLKKRDVLIVIVKHLVNESKRGYVIVIFKYRTLPMLSEGKTNKRWNYGVKYTACNSQYFLRELVPGFPTFGALRAPFEF